MLSCPKFSNDSAIPAGKSTPQAWPVPVLAPGNLCGAARGQAIAYPQTLGSLSQMDCQMLLEQIWTFISSS